MTASLFASPETWLATVLFSMLRIGAAFAASPVFSALGMPVIVRVSLSLVVGILLAERTPIDAAINLLSMAGLIQALCEIAVGVILGFSLQLVFAAPLLAGEYISSTMGLGFAAMVDPQSGTSTPAISLLLSIYTTLAFLALDGHLFLIETIVRSYDILPVSGNIPFADLSKELFDFGWFVFVAGLGIALPVGVCIVAANLMIAMMTRSAPQMNIFSIGVPLTILIGLIAMTVFFPGLADLIGHCIEDGVAFTARLASGAGPLK